MNQLRKKGYGWKSRSSVRFFHTVVLILLSYLYDMVILAKTVHVIVTKTKTLMLKHAKVHDTSVFLHIFFYNLTSSLELLFSDLCGLTLFCWGFFFTPVPNVSMPVVKNWVCLFFPNGPTCCFWRQSVVKSAPSAGHKLTVEALLNSPPP